MSTDTGWRVAALDTGLTFACYRYRDGRVEHVRNRAGKVRRFRSARAAAAAAVKLNGRAYRPLT